jgi:hypothetical protein
VLSADSLQRPAEETTLIAEAEELRLHPLLFGNRASFVTSMIGKACPGEQLLLRKAALKALAEWEMQLIAEYDSRPYPH